ncbi:MAG TPA: hypothetical protein VEV84_13230 [Pyrinomonadaceae bacterium]|nr:hypothetical protein [Pyrinomonadaceae bacterium]
MIAAAEYKTELRISRRPISWKSTGAVCSFGSGFICAIVGATLWLLSFLTHDLTDGLGTIMVIFAFVFLGCGSHCLDLIEKDRRQNPH